MSSYVTKPVDKSKVKHVAASYDDKPPFRCKGSIYLIITSLRSKRLKYIADDLSVRSALKIGFKILDKSYIDEEVLKFNRR